ncbi:MAG: hemolysin family protein [Ignavibacteriaceae bacterium]|jgi:CBS domain containing-hemolysin-like protein|nr:hemolysin family protein [Ignavibacteriaceae bacterium]
MDTNILILLLMIAASAFFSSTEIAFVISNKIKIEVLARKKNIAAENLLYFVKKPEHFFSTILIWNNIVNIGFASLAAIILYEKYHLSDLQILFVSTFIILLFGELIPKYFAREFADNFILWASIPLRICSVILKPVIIIISSISAFFTKSKSLNETSTRSLISREDLESLLDESHEAGEVNKKESNLIKRVLDLREQRIYEAMRPRTEIIGVEISSSIEEVIQTFIDSAYSKLPVYEENVDNIKGFVLAYDVFSSPTDVQSIMREMYFVPETKKTAEVLEEFLAKRLSIAAVVDEFGGTAGIVTMEDIIEELFGEIKDEYDVEENICRKLEENTYLISGKVEIDFVNEKYSLNFPLGDYETVSGFITSKSGKIPSQGEIILIGNFEFNILRTTQVKIDLVKLTLKMNE